MANDGEYIRRLGEGEIHGEKLRFEWFWVEGLRGGERAAAFAGDEGGGQLGLGGTRLSYVAATAAPLAVALHHLLPRHREWRGQKWLVV
jgi:hypothetical protein